MSGWRPTPVHLVNEGQLVLATVVNVADFGVFVELVPRKLDGLIHFKMTGDPDRVRALRVGQAVPVIVTTVDRDELRVFVDVAPDP
jgi:ribosomal protein S1